jgi:hypothetical protein
MPEFFEYDPLFGIKTETAYDEMSGELTVYRQADVQPYLDHAHAQRQELGLNRQGIKENWWCYASIDPVTQLQLRAKGLDIGNPEHTDRIIAEINTNYPNLKMTTGKMGGKVKQYFNT